VNRRADAIGHVVGQIGAGTSAIVRWDGNRDGDGHGVQLSGLTLASPVQRAWISRESAPRLIIGVFGFSIASGKCSLKTAAIFPCCPAASFFFSILQGESFPGLLSVQYVGLRCVVRWTVCLLVCLSPCLCLVPSPQTRPAASPRAPSRSSGEEQRPEHL